MKTPSKQFTYVVEDGQYKLKYTEQPNHQLTRVRSQLILHPNNQITDLQIPKLQLEFNNRKSKEDQDQISSVSSSSKYVPKYFTSRKIKQDKSFISQRSFYKQQETPKMKAQDIFELSPIKQAFMKNGKEKNNKQLQQKIKELNSKLVQKQNQINYLKHMEKNFFKQKETMQKNNNNLMQINKDLGQKLRLISRGLYKPQDQVKQKYQKQIRQLIDKIEYISREQYYLTQGNQMLRNQNFQLKETVKSLQIIVSRMRKQNQILQNLQKTKDLYENLKQNSKKQIIRLNNEIIQLKQRYENQIMYLRQQKSKSMEQIQNRYKELNNEIYRLGDKLEQQKQDFARQKRVLEKKYEKNEEQYENRINEICKRYQELKQKHNGIVMQLKKLEQSNNEYGKLLGERDSRIRDKQKNIEELEQKLVYMIYRAQQQRNEIEVQVQKKFIDELRQIQQQFNKQKQIIINVSKKSNYCKSCRNNKMEQQNYRDMVMAKDKMIEQLKQNVLQLQIDYDNLKSQHNTLQIKTKNQIINLKNQHQRALNQLTGIYQKTKNNEQNNLKKIKRYNQQILKKDQLIQKILKNNPIQKQSKQIQQLTIINQNLLRKIQQYQYALLTKQQLIIDYQNKFILNPQKKYPQNHLQQYYHHQHIS